MDSTEKKMKPALDRDVLDALKELDGPGESTIKELGPMFLRSAAHQLEIIRSYAEMKSFEKVKKEVHSLKSSSASLGALQLSKMAKDIEGLKEVNFPHLLELISEMDEEFQRVQRELEYEIRKTA